MLKSSIHSCVSAFTILLLIATVIEPRKYHDTINHTSHHSNYHNQVNDNNQFSTRLTRAFEKRFEGRFDRREKSLTVSAINSQTCVVLPITRLIEENNNTINIINVLRIPAPNTIIYFLRDPGNKVPINFISNPLDYNNLSTRSNNRNASQTLFSDSKRMTLLPVRKNRNDESNPIEYKWRKRTLCGFSEDNHSTKRLHPRETEFVRKISTEKAKEPEKTLLNYVGPDLFNEIEDSDPLEPHVRVKRNEPKFGEFSPFKYHANYLRDLANSFPQGYYDSIDESSDDDDVSLINKKRRIKSDESTAEEFSRMINDTPSSENDLSVNDDISPSASINTKEIISEAPGVPGNRTNAEENENSNCREKRDLKINSVKESAESDALCLNKKPEDVNTDVVNVPEDPLLAKKLIRTERNEKKTSQGNDENIPDKSDFFGNADETDCTGKKQENSGTYPLNALTLRNRRRATAKGKNHGKNTKVKKKKKRAGKKRRTQKLNSHGSSKKHSSPLVHGTTRLRKESGNKAMIKNSSQRSIAKGAIKNNMNRFDMKIDDSVKRFHRRSFEPKKSVRKIIDEVEFENDLSPHHNSLSSLMLNDPQRDEITADNSANLKGSRTSTSSEDDPMSDLKRVRDESETSRFAEKENQIVSRHDERSSLDGIKLRAKRDKDSEGHHGFQNEQDELRYYEDIRESEPEPIRCVDQPKTPNTGKDRRYGSRTVRSIEEVKDLAKKLVAKVNDLQSYLNNDNTKRKRREEEKNVEVRAIDDLCSNVSTACAVFNEAPKIVQRCVSSPKLDYISRRKKIVARKADPKVNTEKRRLQPSSNNNNNRSVEQKRKTRRGGAGTSSNPSRTAKREGVKKPRHKWGRWTDWSSCSVTCGKGRQIRWRYCLQDCSTAETEMEEKACQLPACPPGKFFGIF